MSFSTSDLATLFDGLRASGVLTVPDFVNALNARGVPAPDGGPWTPAKVSRTLFTIATDRTWRDRWLAGFGQASARPR
jgi:hypothetical protein